MLKWAQILAVLYSFCVCVFVCMCGPLFVSVCVCQEIQRPYGLIRETEGYIIQGTTLHLQELGRASFT